MSDQLDELKETLKSKAIKRDDVVLRTVQSGASDSPAPTSVEDILGGIGVSTALETMTKEELLAFITRTANVGDDGKIQIRMDVEMRTFSIQGKPGMNRPKEVPSIVVIPKRSIPSANVGGFRLSFAEGKPTYVPVEVTRHLREKGVI